MFIQKVQQFIICLLTLLVIFPYFVNAQITVHINSGNPATPFPQFLAYTHSTGQF